MELRSSMRPGVLGRPRRDGNPPVQRRIAVSGQRQQATRRGRRRGTVQAVNQPEPDPEPHIQPQILPHPQQSGESPQFRSTVLTTMNMISDRLQSMSERILEIEQRPNQSRVQFEQSTASTTRDQSETPIQARRETTTTSSVYDPVTIRDRQVSIARANANRIKLRGNKLTGSNYADWKRTVYLQLEQLKIEHLLTTDPDTNDQNELDTDRELVTAIRILLEDDVRAAVDRHACKSAKDLWTAIEQENSAVDDVARTTNLQFITRHKLQSLKDLTEHCKKFAAAVHQLSTVGATFSKKSEVEMFLATLSHHHNQFVMHVQSHIRNQNLDLTQTFIYCQREAPTYLGNSAQSVNSINKRGQFPNNTGWNKYSNRSRGNRLSQKNKHSNKFRSDNRPSFSHMKRRRNNHNSWNNYNERNNPSNNYSNRSNNSNYNNFRSNDDDRSGRQNRFGNNERYRRQSNVRAISHQPHDDGNESDESRPDNRSRVNRSVSAAVRNALAQRNPNDNSSHHLNAAIRVVRSLGIRGIYLELPYGTLTWIFDTGADVHVVNKFELLKNVRKVSVILGGYNGYTTEVEYVGEVHLVLADRQIPIVLKNVHYVPSAEYNYLSHTALDEDHLFTLTKNGVHLMHDDGTFSTVTKVIQGKQVIQLHNQNIGSVNSNRKLNRPIASASANHQPGDQQTTDYAVTNVKNRLGGYVTPKARIRSYKTSCGIFTQAQRSNPNYLPIQHLNYAAPIINRVYNVGENHLIPTGEVAGRTDCSNGEEEPPNYMNKCSPAMFIHVLFNHCGKGVTKRICEENGISFQDYNCHSCQFHKFLNEIPRIRVNDPLHPFHLVHIDLIVFGGNRIGWDKSKYALVIVEDFSEYGWVYTIEKKSEVTEIMINWFSYVETQYGFPIKQIRCDNAKEFVDGDLQFFLTRMGTVYQRTVPGHPNQNGVVENRIRTLKSKGECVLDHAPANQRDLVRPEALKHVMHMLNLTPFGPNTNLCPAAILGEAHVPQRFYRFYEPVYTETSRSSCTPDHAVGFEDHNRGYRVYNPSSKTVYRAASLRPANGTKFRVNTYLDHHLN